MTQNNHFGFPVIHVLRRDFRNIWRISSHAFLLVLLATGFLTVEAALGQANFGSINGTVTDSTDAVIPGATVVVTNSATGITKSLATDSGGFYSAGGLSAGTYTVEISASGFQSAVFSGLELTPGQTLAQKAKLSVSTLSSQVVVSANALQVNTQTSGSGGTISSNQISNLMLNGRNFQTLAISIPGVNSTAGADSLSGGGLQSNTTLIVNGQSSEYTTYTIDGIYNVGTGNLAQIDILPIVDGIAEFTVLKNNYSANYGFAGSGQIVVQTKQGGTDFHGDAWNYLRNDALDASNFFSTAKQSLHQNIFGYTLGGPVIIPGLYNMDRKRKTFFFASNQWYDISAGQVARGSVMTQAMRNGNFSQSPTLPAAGSLTLDSGSVAVLASTGRTQCLTSPTTINPSCIDAVAAALLKQNVPLPNNPSGGFLNYINQKPKTNHEVDYHYRIDQQIGNSLLSGRMMYQQVNTKYPYDGFDGFIFDTFTDSFYTPGMNALLRFQSTVTPNLINTFSAAEVFTKPFIAGTGGNPTLPSGVSIIQSFPNAPTKNRIPNVSISKGWSSFGVGSQPITASDGEGVLQDDASWVHGKHVFQAGLLYMFGIKRQTVFTLPQGSFTFSGTHTGDPAADFLLGLNSTYSQASTQRQGSFHYREGDWYVRDDWHALRRLTFNLGLRWVYYSNDTASGDQVTSFNPALYTPAQAPVVNIGGTLAVNSLNQPLTSSGSLANLLNGLAFAGQNGVPSGFFIPKKTNFGPRVGFAWDLFGDGKTSLRGGYGIGYTRIGLAQIYYAFGQNPPFNNSANILNSTLSNATLGVGKTPTAQTLSDVPLEFRPSQLQSYSLTFERQIIPNLIADVAYAGSVARHLEVLSGAYDGNAPLPVSAPSQSGCLASNQTASAAYDFDPCINTGVASRDFTRPYKGYSAMNDFYHDGFSSYNSLQTSLRYRASNFQLSLAYTYQKALATVGGHTAGTPYAQLSRAQNSRNFHAEYGPPSYDFTNSFTATGVYNIPFKATNLVMRGLFSNWMISGLALHQSGFAMSPALSTSTPGLAIRPNTVAHYSKVGKLSEWFDTGAFAAPLFGFYGNASNGVIRGPSYTSFNAGLAKTFPVVEKLHGQFRAEAFNLANHPNFKSVDTGLGSGTYGHVTSAGDPRILEFALKVIY
jgi:hypothetical protein